MNSKEALKNLKDIIGEEAYRQVLEQLAGATVYFPALPSNAEWLDKGQRNRLFSAIAWIDIILTIEIPFLFLGKENLMSMIDGNGR